MRATILLLAVGFGCGSFGARSAEAWSDPALPVRDGLVLWFDATRANAAREAAQIPALANGGPADLWHDGSGLGAHLRQRIPGARPRLRLFAQGAAFEFDGRDDFLAAAHARPPLTNATVFVRAQPRSNAGGFRGFLAFSGVSRNDYTSGFALDFGPFASTDFASLNIEGNGFGGARDLLEGGQPFGGLHTIAFTIENGKEGVRLFLDGLAQGRRPRTPSTLVIEEITVGARCYSNAAEPPHTQGFFDGLISEILVYQRVLTDAERRQVEQYLAAKHKSDSVDASGRKLVPLTAVTNPPPVQMFVPGFTVRELPVRLKNVNNVKYRADGRLVALGYDGNIYLLSDTDGDGREDHAAVFWDKPTLRSPIGLALTPPGYARGEGVFVPAKGKLSLIVDTNRDDTADQEIIVAEGWPELPHGVDALGVALDREGNVYFGLGTANFTDGYLRDLSGRARYDLKNERGTILKVSADFSRREIFCTGIRFPVALAFNRHGDLFCTDQEGATWLPNGNPFDELVHVQPGRHYGFPPRHPRHLPGVIDEPNVFDYTPQHQSTCGLNFNDAVNGGPIFGPGWWAGDALVSGYSRGKLYRTKLVKTAAGYVAQNQLVAGLNMLVADACVSPRGDLVVAVHSGGPDWGSGPTGEGKLYQVSYHDRAAPQPVLVWPASPTETHIEFDRPLDATAFRNVAKAIRITEGKYVSAGDAFETLRPGYAVVQNQLAAARYELPVLSAGVSADRRALILATPPRTVPVNYAITLPPAATAARPLLPNELPQLPVQELAHDLTGVEGSWRAIGGDGRWVGWLPHADLAAARELTRASARHEELWHALRSSGELTLRMQLDLWQMLIPAVQPGSRIDYTPPREKVTLTVRAGTAFRASVRGRPAKAERKGDGAYELSVTEEPRENDWLPLELTVPTGGGGGPRLELAWHTSEDSRARALPLRRFFLPWATATSTNSPAEGERTIPELAGGQWLHGRRLYFSDQLGCYKCHRIRGEGGSAGPDLSNLIHRDYASVLKDIASPNAAINPDHVAFNVELKNGEALAGVLQSDQREHLVFADASGRAVTLPKAEIASLRASTLSLMPEGLVATLEPQPLKDLMTFLLTVPLEPAPLEIRGEPPPRARAEFQPLLEARTASAAKARSLHVVLAAGPKDHGPGEHDYPLWQKRWQKLLALADDVTVSTAMGWPSAEQFKRADVIVFYSNNPGWSAERGGELDAFLGRGGGLVYVHYAVDGHQHVEALAERIGLAWRGGGSRFRHGALELKLHSHPLAAGLGRLNFIDESYWQLVGQPQHIDLLASGVEDGREQPLIWTRTNGKGRVFVSILGHYTWTFDDPLFRTLLLRGISWAGGEPMDRLSELATVGARIAP